MEDWKPIVKVSGEGGSLKLMRITHEHDEEFKIVADDMFLEEVFEEDLDDFGGQEEREVIVIEPTIPITMHGWKAAVDGMRRRLFHRLLPKMVDSEFAERVWEFIPQHADDLDSFLINE